MAILQNADNQSRILVLLQVSIPKFRDPVFEVVSVTQIPVSTILMDDVEDKAEDAKYDEAKDAQRDFEEKSHVLFREGAKAAA